MVLVSGASCPRETRGLHQNFLWRTADAGGAADAVVPPHPPRPLPLAYAQQVIHPWAPRRSTPSVTRQVVLPLERRRGAPRRQGLQRGETAVNRGQHPRRLPALLRVCARPAEGWLPSVWVLLFSHHSSQFSLFCTSLKKKLGSHCKRNRVLLHRGCGWT